MRLVVACNRCRRQYDASKLGVGKKFRCHCGNVVAVAAPRGHEAAVVRCSSCGAPRDEHAPACTHCGADFTIHETDLDTVCPECLARISDRARFCHHCGNAVGPSLAAGDTTSLPCPACGNGSQLVTRLLGNHSVAAAECPHCAGLWIDEQVFGRLVRQAQAHLQSDDALAGVGTAPQTTVSQRMSQDVGWRYRNCPVCGKMMQRRNYARKSGVIVDVCREHGTWFDADELHRILQWIRAGGLDFARREVSRDAQAWQHSLDSRRRSAQASQELFDDDWDNDRRGGFRFSLLGAIEILFGE